MKKVENSVAGIETDGMETLPSKTPVANQSDIFRQNSFKCPVCGLTGGPTFIRSGNYRVSVLLHGLRIPSDHCPECFDKADVAYFYTHGLMDDAQMGTYVHTADAEQCSHPKCMGERLYRKAVTS